MNESINLGRDETIILRGKIHWGRLIFPGLLALLFLISSAKTMLLGGLFIAVIILGIAALPMYTEQLVLTSKRLYGKTGLIKTNTLDTPLNKVNTVSVSSGLFGKIIGYGTIHITSSSGSYKYPGIADPNVFRQALMEQIEKYDEERIKRQAAEMARAIKQ